MTRMTGRALGLGSLRLDALYCLVLGAIVAAAAGQIASVVALPRTLIVMTGILVLAWAALVLWMAERLPIRVALRVVLGVNIVATALIAAASVTAANWLAITVVLATAVEVGLFAVSQVVALRRIGAVDGPAQPA